MMSSSEGHICKRKRGSKMDENHSSLVPSNHTKDNYKEEKEKEKEKITTTINRYGLVSFRDLPDYMKDNEYILGYYRVHWPIKIAFFSLFRWHNETLNVWTHLIGFALFLGLTIANSMQVPQVANLLSKFTRSFYTIPTSNVSHDTEDFFLGTSAVMNLGKITPPEIVSTSSTTIATRWPFFVFLGGSMFCLLTSSICHLFCCHSRRLSIFLLRLDYAGIAIMIVTSFFPPIYYIFQCDPHWQFIYLAVITTMGIFTVITLLSPSFSTGAFRSFRALLFFSMGFSGIVPAIHAVVVNWSEPRCSITLAYESVMALSYAAGTLFYVSRIPERWKPGWFDLAGHSHQIFHVFVIMGAFAHYGAALIFLEWRDNVGCK